MLYSWMVRQETEYESCRISILTFSGARTVKNVSDEGRSGSKSGHNVVVNGQAEAEPAFVSDGFLCAHHLCLSLLVHAQNERRDQVQTRRRLDHGKVVTNTVKISLRMERCDGGRR